MRLCELVGKPVFRIEPMANGDRSYMDNSANTLYVMDVVDGIPLVRVVSNITKGDSVSMFNGYLNDDKWADATRVYGKIDEYNKLLHIMKEYDRIKFA